MDDIELRLLIYCLIPLVRLFTLAMLETIYRQPGVGLVDWYG